MKNACSQAVGGQGFSDLCITDGEEIVLYLLFCHHKSMQYFIFAILIVLTLSSSSIQKHLKKKISFKTKSECEVLFLKDNVIHAHRT